MRILITNDDGIEAPCLPHLAQFAKALGEVVVVAPKVEQSGKSHAIEIYKKIEIKEVDLGVGVRAYSMDSTPADCVRLLCLVSKRSLTSFFPVSTVVLILARILCIPALSVRFLKVDVSAFLPSLCRPTRPILPRHFRL